MMPLGEVIGGFEAGVSVNAEDRPAEDHEHGVLKVSAVGLGRFDSREQKAVLPGELTRLGPSLHAGDLLVTRANTLELVGAAATVDRDYPNLHLSDKTWRVLHRRDEPNTRRWLPFVLNSSWVRNELRKRATGSSGSMKNVAQEAFLGIEVPVPPEAQRGAIADALRTLTRAPAVSGDLLDLLRIRKRCLMQQLLSGRQSLTGISRSAWTSCPLASLLHESREAGASGAEAKKLTIRLYGRGVVAKSDLRPGSRRTQYYRRRRGQFIYSKLDFLNGAFGLVPDHLDGYESTLDLPAFDVSASVDARWLLRLFSWSGFYRARLRLANGGRKARRVNPNQLLVETIPVPPMSEQRAVAALFDALDREIVLLERQRELLDQQRRVVTDKLLSGEVRVQVPGAKVGV